MMNSLKSAMGKRRIWCVLLALMFVMSSFQMAFASDSELIVYERVGMDDFLYVYADPSYDGVPFTTVNGIIELTAIMEDGGGSITWELWFDSDDPLIAYIDSSVVYSDSPATIDITGVSPGMTKINYYFNNLSWGDYVEGSFWVEIN